MIDFHISESEHLLDRELSWLAFNRRVLEQATQDRMPLLERLRFLGIFSSNLDEFFMKRIGGLKRQITAGVTQPNRFGRSPAEEIELLRSSVDPSVQFAHEIFANHLVPALSRQGVFLKTYAELDPAARARADQHFRSAVFPLLTPFAVDAGHPFPIISNLSTSLGVALRHRGSDEMLFARVKLSHIAQQWIRISDSRDPDRVFLSLESLVSAHLDALFPGLEIISITPFRVTRNAGLEVSSDDDADDLLELVEEELRQRRFAEVVRVQHGPQPSPWIKEFLIENLEITADDVYGMPSTVLTYQDFAAILEIQKPELRFPVWTPQTDPEVSEEPRLFDRIRYADLLVHHPYDSFYSSVERFIREAAEDPDVHSIKMTVYRVGDSTPLIPLLIRAAEYGKNVVCLIEVKARFDEERNIQWAYTLEDAGVHVVYGIPGLKTHAKTVVVVRQEAGQLRTYAHIGTGNYHTHTANLYTDLGLFTCRPDITVELMDFFNYLTGRSMKGDYQSLLVAPSGMEPAILEAIEREIIAAQDGRPAGIIAQLNNLEDVHIIDALYRASRAGVSIDLIIRGVCCLRPGLPGVSESIRVRSILGRFLEHARLFYFRDGAEDAIDGRFYMSSADWMGRNLHRRVELAVPIHSRELRVRCFEMFKMLLREDIFCWHLEQDGSYSCNSAGVVDVQDIFMNDTLERIGHEY